ncbi:hypothetical protein F11_11000 [Rhodospirillum rubrum F11]|uniref:Carboxylesterase n=3 Tax=Rhodospirillum rubrum TaxID=1085 RepID=Q2RSF9_RHORT|nr:holin family protein [Rhodospirillum rubrum]ABC22936.1 hypothetical protein Rru_A2136 [Rhodospirillum rubrum ATCC 11170]AEO48664.1 hypothetical protein F11_11000 [Rhodospirillum rubrum F11]MBK5954557.1 hypothetical protein [Rhodospirillum rubrum]QXG78923.1 holin family protein [Rhodospirillum rubrum]
MWDRILGLLGAGGLSAVKALVGRFVADKDAAAAAVHAETLRQLEIYGAESAGRSGATAWDSLVDGLNRLPRPLMAFAVMAMMVWAPLDPIGFAEAMRAYALVPEWLATTLFGVAAFYFTARHFEKRLELGGPPKVPLERVIGDIAAMEAMRPKNNRADKNATALASPTGQSPLDNQSLLDWRRRNGGNIK